MASLTGLVVLVCCSVVAAEKLKMSLYYESQCPDCDGFIANDLHPVWNKINGYKYLDLELIPYGNAETRQSPEGSIQIVCQHGPDECKGNILHNCALKYIPTKDLQLAFVTCTFFSKRPYKAGGPCSKLLKIDFNPIRNCTHSPEGARLHYLAGNKTNSLSPAHQYVPWIIFDDTYNQQEMEEAQSDFFGFLCKKLGSKQLSPPECEQIGFRAQAFQQAKEAELVQNSIEQE